MDAVFERHMVLMRNVRESKYMSAEQKEKAMINLRFNLHKYAAGCLMKR